MLRGGIVAYTNGLCDGGVSGGGGLCGGGDGAAAHYVHLRHRAPPRASSRAPPEPNSFCFRLGQFHALGVSYNLRHGLLNRWTVH